MDKQGEIRRAIEEMRSAAGRFRRVFEASHDMPRLIVGEWADRVERTVVDAHRQFFPFGGAEPTHGGQQPHNAA